MCQGNTQCVRVITCRFDKDLIRGFTGIRRNCGWPLSGSGGLLRRASLKVGLNIPSGPDIEQGPYHTSSGYAE
jgi:hypothetical protein